MSKLNQIKSNLLELEGGKFQRLCDDWLHRKGYGNINPIGMMTKTDRVAKGTPDTLLPQEDGAYIFAEYSVQQKEVYKKFEDDIKKCLNNEKTGIPKEKIKEILIFHLGKLSTAEIEKLRELCTSQGIKLTLNNIDSLALSIQNHHPILSELYLGLPLDTGQIVSIDDFVKKYCNSEFATPIDNEMLFQDENISNEVSKLQDSKALLVSGSAGTGKTLFAINVAKKYKQENPKTKIYALYDKGADLTRDITAHLSEPGDYLIFVDDANRLDNRLDYILYYLNENDQSRTFKIIATVRDYAKDSVTRKISKLTTFNEIVISPLQDNQIEEMLKENFSIHNPTYLKRIQEISCGNCRLAVMAAKVALETNQIESIHNVASLYDDYFRSNENVKAALDDPILISTLCAISFLRKVDIKNEMQMAYIQNPFGLSQEEFLKQSIRLNKLELVDVYENEVVKISDQVLSTYFFYASVFEKRRPSFRSIVESFYPDLKSTLIDSLNPVISAFDHKQIIKEIKENIKAPYSKIKNSGTDEEILSFLNTFWFSLPTESLKFSSEVVSNIPKNEADWEELNFDTPKSGVGKSEIVSLLTKFRYFGEAEFKISFSIFLSHVENNPDSLQETLYALGETYNFKLDDCQFGYYIQNHVIETLIEKMDHGRNYLFTRLFIFTASRFLDTDHRENHWSRGGNITIYSYKLKPDEHLTKIREKIIKSLSTLFSLEKYQHFVLLAIKEYISKITFSGPEIAASDFPFIRDELIPNFDNENPSHCLALQDYMKNLDRIEMEYPNEWRKFSLHDIVVLYNAILDDDSELWAQSEGLDDYENIRKEKIKEYLLSHHYKKFDDFIKKSSTLKEILCKRDGDHLLNNGIEKTLIVLSEQSPDSFPEILSSYLKKDAKFKINPFPIISRLFELLDAREAWETITKNKFDHINLWVSHYYQQLPENEISYETCESLIGHIKNCLSHELPMWIDFLEKYIPHKEDIYSEFVRILVTKSASDPYFARPIERLFNRHNDKFGEWFNIFKCDESLPFDAYLSAIIISPHFDHNGEALKALVHVKFSFLYQLVDCIYEKEDHPSIYTNMPDLQFLWDRENYIEEIIDYSKYILKKDPHAFAHNDSLLRRLFSNKNGTNKKAAQNHRKMIFFKEAISRNTNDIKYICFIFNSAKFVSQEWKIKLLRTFLEKNKDLEDFKYLNRWLTARSWSGSRVPILQREMELQVSVMATLDSADLILHRAFLEEEIANKEQAIAYEKKRDYLEHD